MAYSQFSQSFGLAFASRPVRITTSQGVPTILLTSSTGGVVSSEGRTFLDASGNLSVFVDDTYTYQVSISDDQNLYRVVADSTKIISEADLSTLQGQAGTVYVVNTAPFARYVWNGTSMEKQVSISASGEGGGVQLTPRVGTVGATTVTIDVKTVGAWQLPFTLTVTPAAATTITAEFSSNNGTSYASLGTVGVRTAWNYDLSPGENWVTHVRLTRATGTATTTTYSLGV